MGFLTGRVTYERFKVGGRDFSTFDEKHLETAERFAIGKVGGIAADGIEVGFTAGDHILDVHFDFEKNVINDALHLAMRVDTNKVPGDLFKAYMQMELAALAANNPSGHPTKSQKQEAREAAEARCEEEAKTGKFKKMKAFPLLWDARQGIVYFGGSNLTAIERFLSLFKESFGRTLTRITAGTLAHDGAAESGHARALEDLTPAVFAGPKRKISVAWVADEFGSRDFLGNEFLLWLWWVLETQSEGIKLADESVVTCMLNKTLSLECPLNETGKETISSEAPTRLPEAKRAILGGKLPRKTGITMVRHEEQYELTLSAESLAVGGAALPKLDSEPGRPMLEDRMDQIRHLSETVDLLFDAFCRRRLSSHWGQDQSGIRHWLEKEE
ncbi:MAG: hypothetical protein U1D30_00870 [Planctomycetota bacterium]